MLVEQYSCISQKSPKNEKHAGKKPSRQGTESGNLRRCCPNVVKDTNEYKKQGDQKGHASWNNIWGNQKANL